jgi:hypothetical protein
LVGTVTTKENKINTEVAITSLIFKPRPGTNIYFECQFSFILIPLFFQEENMKIVVFGQITNDKWSNKAVVPSELTMTLPTAEPTKSSSNDFVPLM